MEHYSSYYAIGMKVGVVIPMAHTATFRDWAIIHEVDEDLVTLQLSRDQLPENVSLHVGQILEVRSGKEGAAYSCRAIIVSEASARQILLRLIGEIVTDELREFYRIDAFLPIKYHVSGEQHPEILEKEWTTRRKQRLDDEMSRKQQRWETCFKEIDSNLPEERHHQISTSCEGDDPDTSWDSIIPLAANISGGGIRIVVHHNFVVGQYVPLEILVPSPRRIVEAVGQVMFANSNVVLGNDRESYSVALKFIFIDERDRDAIVNHIAGVQLKRIRQLREHFSLGYGLENDDDIAETIGWKAMVRKTAIALVLICLFSLMVGYFQGYATNPSKGEIAQTFEKGIKRYLEKIGGK